MRYFTLLDFQYVVLLVFLGLSGLIVIYLAFSGYGHERGRRKRPDETEDYPEGIQVERNRIPPILIFVYIAFILWAVGYVIVIGLRGKAF
ncbi:MAG: hypothetical protein GTN74_01860 [Proteobacteria bacterium]|nr:hypothetical protein [Pseudomonadota bacterium]NIS67870.1 hypothetical protein [Pseudomonadota bacterium]